ncbi:MAG: type II secretion system F family protein [Candidatus ainarchaeum sp.]|nr:type II secretion system F family protein [Candidatus ainarchaeum sp.]
MIESVPLMPLPYKPLKPLIRGYFPVASIFLRMFPSLEKDLEEIKSKISAKEYVGGALLSFTIYFFLIGTMLAIWGLRNNFLDLNGRMIIVTISLSVSFAIFFYTLLLPKWMLNKQKRELEKSLLFAARHLMIQTNAGVPLFDAIVSVSEEYGNQNLDYGEISREFRRIVKEVKSGADLTQALEDSAKRNPSTYYRRIIWQLANTNKSGSEIGPVLKSMVEFLSDEQRIVIQAYGSQLNPLALFYMLMCIIAPTMGLILMMIASTFIELPVNDFTFPVILLILVIFQIMFIGMIKSRRPTVAL